ncbi:tail fiber assembly protein [Yersinia wautersii]|uniref:tail fiber assembly protein n=1 Tax=Yersinia wautersii TaxID=1341643 RepID=UPI00041FC178|nr:tail fiber assembly protein [Yersinia wautersii]
MPLLLAPTLQISPLYERINVLTDAVTINNQETDIQQLVACKHYHVALMRTNAAPKSPQ